LPEAVRPEAFVDGETWSTSAMNDMTFKRFAVTIRFVMTADETQQDIIDSVLASELWSHVNELAKQHAFELDRDSWSLDSHPE
jgi:hypothetical protein